MGYEKPVVSAADTFEGVYMASGMACDCFTYYIEKEETNPGSYWLTYYILQKSQHNHDNNDFGHFSMTLTFNKEIRSSWTFTGPTPSVKGNQLTYGINSTISPYYQPVEGLPASCYGIGIRGEGAETLKCTDIQAQHY